VLGKVIELADMVADRIGKIPSPDLYGKLPISIHGLTATAKRYSRRNSTFMGI
jgi:hypothetical protein